MEAFGWNQATQSTLNVDDASCARARRDEACSQNRQVRMGSTNALSGLWIDPCRWNAAVRRVHHIIW